MVEKKTNKKKVEEAIEENVKKKLDVIKEEMEKEASETEKMLETGGRSNETEEFNYPGDVVFNCPSCAKGRIKRTYHERVIATKYRCSVCSFEGPN